MRAGEDRLRRRYRLYLLGLVPAVALLSLSARLLLLLHHEDRALAAYQDGRYTVAQRDFALNGVLNPVERWVAPFAEGDARFRRLDYQGAVVAFDHALTLAPAERECLVRVNLGLAHEAVGDAYAERRSHAQAADSWSAGRKAVRGCRPGERRPASPDRRDLAGRLDARLLRKLGVEAQPDAQPQRPQLPDEAEESSEERRRRLEERNRQALEDRLRQQRDRRDDGERDPDDPEDPPGPGDPPVPLPTW